MLSPDASEADSERERRAQRAVQQCTSVIAQKSAEAVVVAHVFTRDAGDEGPNMNTRRSHGQLVRGDEPDRGSHWRRWAMPPALFLR